MLEERMDTGSAPVHSINRGVDMREPLQVVSRNMPPSKIIGQLVRRKMHELEASCDCIIKCRATLETAHKNQRAHYNIHLNIELPGRSFEIISHHEREHECLNSAIRETFAAARRQLYGHARANTQSFTCFNREPPAALPPA